MSVLFSFKTLGTDYPVTRRRISEETTPYLIKTGHFIFYHYLPISLESIQDLKSVLGSYITHKSSNIIT